MEKHGHPAAHPEIIPAHHDLSHPIDGGHPVPPHLLKEVGDQIKKVTVGPGAVFPMPHFDLPQASNFLLRTTSVNELREQRMRHEREE